MPSVKKGETKEEYLKKCIPIMIKEGKEQNQAIAACLSMYKNKWQENKASSDDGDGLNNNTPENRKKNNIRKNDSEIPMSPTENPTRSEAKNFKNNKNMSNNNKKKVPPMDVTITPDKETMASEGIDSKYENGQFKFDLDISKSKAGIDWSKKPLRLESTKEGNILSNLDRSDASYHSKSEHEVKCDGCGCTISKSSYNSDENKDSYPLKECSNRSHNYNLYIRHPNGSTKETHACSLGCLAKVAQNEDESHKKWLQQELERRSTIEDSKANLKKN